MNWNSPKPHNDPWYEWAYDKKYDKGSYERDSKSEKEDGETASVSRGEAPSGHEAMHGIRESGLKRLGSAQSATAGTGRMAEKTLAGRGTVARMIVMTTKKQMSSA